jgi:hypothetical protein
MVNADRVKKKLPSLLCDGDTSERKNNDAFMRNRYRLRQLQKRKPQRFNCLINQLCTILDKINKEIVNQSKIQTITA